MPISLEKSTASRKMFFEFSSCVVGMLLALDEPLTPIRRSRCTALWMRGRARWPTGRLYSPAVPQAGTLRNGTCERVRTGWPRGCLSAVLSTEVVLEQYVPRNCAHGPWECCPQSLPAEAIVAARRWPSERAVAGTLRCLASCKAADAFAVTDCGAVCATGGGESASVFSLS